MPHYLNSHTISLNDKHDVEFKALGDYTSEALIHQNGKGLGWHEYLTSMQITHPKKHAPLAQKPHDSSIPSHN